MSTEEETAMIRETVAKLSIVSLFLSSRIT